MVEKLGGGRVVWLKKGGRGGEVAVLLEMVFFFNFKETDPICITSSPYDSTIAFANPNRTLTNAHPGRNMCTLMEKSPVQFAGPGLCSLLPEARSKGCSDPVIGEEGRETCDGSGGEERSHHRFKRER
ncbi:hypothetical protein L1987_23268 [Smallanthus sonchifolius]|uniref:Uncharacterized protein n=1 Tax=Smallanthus sonchifolius TaxID=185202 RepID=A0ACB9IJT7_9ASTR|nr:hypothetical protein L1987_23268 [Smallanthus sonchifolius]